MRNGTIAPNGVSSATSVIQKIGSTTLATITITDADAVAQGVSYYKVFVRVGAPATTSDKYQVVNAVGSTDINLATLVGGAVNPANVDVVNFTVVAYNASGTPSTPAVLDKATVTWDKSVVEVSPTDYIHFDESGVAANDGRIDASASNLEIGEAVTLQYIIKPSIFPLPPVYPSPLDTPTGTVSIANVPAGPEITANQQVITGLDGDNTRIFSPTTVDAYVRYMDVYGNTGSWVKIQ